MSNPRDSDVKFAKDTAHGVDVTGNVADVAHQVTNVVARSAALIGQSSMASVANSIGQGIGILSPFLLLIGSAANLFKAVKKRAQATPRGIAKISLYAGLVGLGLAGIILVAAAPVVVLPLMAAASGLTFFRKLASLIRSVQAHDKIENLIEQKQEKLKAAQADKDPEKITELQQDVFALQALAIKEKELALAKLHANTDAAQIALIKQEMQQLQDNQTVLVLANQNLKNISHAEQLAAAQKLLQYQREKRNERIIQTVLQGLTFVGLVLLAIPFPPIQMLGAVLVFGAALVGLGVTIAKYHHEIAQGIQKFVGQIQEEVSAGFPTVRKFFATMVNDFMQSIGFRQPFVQQTLVEVVTQKNPVFKPVGVTKPEIQSEVTLENSLKKANKTKEDVPIILPGKEKKLTVEEKPLFSSVELSQEENEPESTHKNH